MYGRGRVVSLVKRRERRMLVKPFEYKELHNCGGIIRMKACVKMICKYINFVLPCIIV